MISRVYLAALLTMAAVWPNCASLADDLQTFEVTFKEHQISPSELHVPTGKPFLIVVKNTNNQADEFEMLIPSVERAVQPGGEAHLRMRPLGPGRFPFFGESDPDNEKGAIVSE